PAHGFDAEHVELRKSRVDRTLLPSVGRNDVRVDADPAAQRVGAYPQPARQLLEVHVVTLQPQLDSAGQDNDVTAQLRLALFQDQAVDLRDASLVLDASHAHRELGPLIREGNVQSVDADAALRLEVAAHGQCLAVWVRQLHVELRLRQPAESLRRDLVEAKLVALEFLPRQEGLDLQLFEFVDAALQLTLDMGPDERHRLDPEIVDVGREAALESLLLDAQRRLATR